MSNGLIASVVAPHTPRIGIEEKAPEFAKGLIGGLRELGTQLRSSKPDLFVLLSSHWVSTFNWYVTAQEVHEGICIADEAPDLIPGVPYRYKGNPAFANKLAENMGAAGVPTGVNDSPHFKWDYGSFVPLQYMDPDAEVPVVLLPSVICSDLDECKKVGRIVHETAEATNLRVVFIASCALSHKVRRGPDNWPTDEHQAMDRRFMEMVVECRIPEMREWSDTFCRESVAEMAGHPLSSMVGASGAMADKGLEMFGRQFGPYTQSSGSGNAALAIFSKNT